MTATKRLSKLLNNVNNVTLNQNDLNRLSDEQDSIISNLSKLSGKKIQIPIGEYENSKEYLKYIKDYAIWLSKGNFNTMKIPSIYKSILGYTDLADKEKLENQ